MMSKKSYNYCILFYFSEDIVRVLFCPENISKTDVENYEVSVSWTDPVFVNKENVSVPHECTHVNGNKMTIGHHNVLCSPVTNSGSGARCRFSVSLKSNILRHLF